MTSSTLDAGPHGSALPGSSPPGPAVGLAPAAERGTLTIDSNVVERIAALAASQAPEVLTRRSLRGSNERGVQAIAQVSPTATDVALTVRLEYPVDTTAVVSAMRKRVAYDIRRLTGLTVAAVRVQIAAFDAPDTRLR